MARRKCVLRGCPHYHYVLDCIGGIRIKLHAFPRGDTKTWKSWRDFVVRHNGSFDSEIKQHILCSAHFDPSLFENWHTLKPGAVPTVSPEVVREIAIKNGDVSHPNPYVLPPRKKVLKNNTEKCPQIIFLEEGKRFVWQKQHSHSCSSAGTSKRKFIGELSGGNFVCPKKSKVALQFIGNARFKIWHSNAEMNKINAEGDSNVVMGSEIEVIEKCTGSCYSH